VVQAHDDNRSAISFDSAKKRLKINVVVDLGAPLVRSLRIGVLLYILGVSDKNESVGFGRQPPQRLRKMKAQ
jgi:hypothetical protein